MQGSKNEKKWGIKKFMEAEENVWVLLGGGRGIDLDLTPPIS
jgi:hypothetical protein